MIRVPLDEASLPEDPTEITSSKIGGGVRRRIEVDLKEDSQRGSLPGVAIRVTFARTKMGGEPGELAGRIQNVAVRFSKSAFVHPIEDNTRDISLISKGLTASLPTYEVDDQAKVFHRHVRLRAERSRTRQKKCAS